MFCAACGAELEPAATNNLGGSSGADAGPGLPQDEAGVSSTAETIKMAAISEASSEAGDELTASGPPILPPPVPPAFNLPPNLPGGSFPWKWVLPVAIACVILAAGAGVALASFTDLGKKNAITTQTFPAYTGTTATSTTSTRSNTTTAKTTKTQTTRTQTDSRTQTYITAMDRLIAKNAQQEKQIVALADQINRVAPGGITDQMLADIDALGMKFLGINTEVDGLDTPSAFGTSTRDFKALTSYNMDRCNSLYAGALAWRSGQPYKDDFATGQTAKDAYYSLYPFFTQEYEQAKAAAP